jgi:DNA-binding NarL/FixJ family response regulator
VLDVPMPRMTGLQAAAELTRCRPTLRVLILSMYDNKQHFTTRSALARRG